MMGTATENQEAFSLQRSETVVPLGTQTTGKAPDQSGRILVLISLWADILNARLLALIAVVGALAIWLYTAYDPTVLRLWAAALYSLVLWPVMWLYAKKGN